MESKVEDQISTSKNAEIKQLKFSNLPRGSSQWIVLACGKIINDRKGGYQQEIVLRKYSEGDKPVTTWNRRNLNDLARVNVNIGSIRVFSPGTIIQNKRILKFAHEYLTKIDISIDDPQSLQKKPLRVLDEPTFPEFERVGLQGSLDPIETRVFDHPELGRVVIPCNVIADYYYYGRNTYLTKAILEGALDYRFASRNEVYNPKKLVREVSETGKIIVRVELQRKMDLRDKFKIARLAHDSYFHDKCSDIYTNILRGTPEASYIDTDLPINQPTVLSVYGVAIRILGNDFFLVHSISKCTAKIPFDLISATKPYRGKGELDNFLPGGGNGDGDGLGIGPKDPPKPRTRRKLKKPENGNVDGDRPQWDAITEDIAFENDQTDNFPADAAINELDFLDPEKRDEVIKTLIKYGFAPKMSTDPNKKGSGLTLPLNFSGQGPAQPRPAQPTQAFDIIERLVSFLELHFRQRDYDTRSSIICPVPEGIDKYSAFPVIELLKEQDQEKRKKYLFYCFQFIQQKQHTHHRRIFINELIISGKYFYIMDVEPKYKTHNKITKVDRLVSSSGVVFYAGTGGIKPIAMLEILKDVVINFKTSKGGWKFLHTKYPIEKIVHRSAQGSYKKIVTFMHGFLR